MQKIYVKYQDLKSSDMFNKVANSNTVSDKSKEGIDVKYDRQ